MAKALVAAVALSAFCVDGMRMMMHKSMAPVSKDWSAHVLPAPDQGGDCNSCYLWAGLGAVESRWSIFTGQPPARLSTQQALDCMWHEHMGQVKRRNSWIKTFGYRGAFGGCGKGEPKTVFQYVLDEGFLLEKDYPIEYYVKRGRDDPKVCSKQRDTNFVGRRAEQCELTPALLDKVAVRAVPASQEGRVKGQVKRFSGPGDWERKAMEALETGPVAIGISASSHGDLMGGRNGPIVSQGGIAVHDCRDHDQSHAVLLVGYGEMKVNEEDEKPTPYWLIRNSWGSNAFDHGYMKIPRGVDFCGAEQLGSYIEFSFGGDE